MVFNFFNNIDIFIVGELKFFSNTLLGPALQAWEKGRPDTIWLVLFLLSQELQSVYFHA